MTRPRSILLLASAAMTLLGSIAARAEARWDHVGVGMTPAEVTDAVGHPLIVSGGRGYQQWTFDAGASIMFHQGIVLHWNTPRGYRAPDPAKAPLIAKHMGGIAPQTGSIAEEATTDAVAPTPDMNVPPAFMEDFRAMVTQPRVRSFSDIVKS